MDHSFSFPSSSSPSPSPSQPSPSPYGLPRYMQSGSSQVRTTIEGTKYMQSGSSQIRTAVEDVEAENINVRKCWRYIPLLKATPRGDWETAQKIFHGDSFALTATITETMDTALHVAVGTGKENIHFVKSTPLHIAACVGNTEAAGILVEKHPPLVYTSREGFRLPIHDASQKETLLYLLEVTKDDGVGFKGESDVEVENINVRKCWRYIPLLKATLRGDWETAEEIFDGDYSALTATITETMDTALHVAVGSGKENIHFVEKLVEKLATRLPVEALAAANRDGRTPLHIAALVGNTKAAKILVKKHPPLVYIRNAGGYLPIHDAAVKAWRKTLSYLWGVTSQDYGEPASDQSRAKFMNDLISSDFYDKALELLERDRHLATLKDGDGRCALESMAMKATAFPSGSGLNYWQRLIYPYVPVKSKKCYVKDHKKTTLDVEDPSKNIPHAHKDNRAQSLGKQTFINSVWQQIQLVQGHALSKKLQAVLWKSLVFSVPQIKHIREKKQIHVEALQLVRTLCEKIISECGNKDAYYGHKIARDGMVLAIRMGIHEIIEEIADWFPSLIWAKDAEDSSIFQRAIINRHEKVFNLVYQMSDHRHLATTVLDKSRNNILHLAGLKAPDNKLIFVSGAALQMQRELQWFEEVKKFVHPSLVECLNDKKETPAMVFTREHKDLVAKGEKWMKDTANSCTITAALIVTVVFAAAITVPGGNNSDNGLPIFSNQAGFVAFAISDAMSLFTSATSLLIFLSILSSQYAERDFLHVLPKRLILGLVTLFLSITTMMVAFSSTLYLVFGKIKTWMLIPMAWQNKAWILIPVYVLALLPITSFATLQFPLLVTLISSTYGKGIFGKQSKKLLY